METRVPKFASTPGTPLARSPVSRKQNVATSIAHNDRTPNPTSSFTNPDLKTRRARQPLRDTNTVHKRFRAAALKPSAKTRPAGNVDQTKPRTSQPSKPPIDINPTDKLWIELRERKMSYMQETAASRQRRGVGSSASRGSQASTVASGETRKRK
jgi:hypothetical protein